MSHDPINRSAQSWKKSEKHGAGEWLAERFTSIALIPLTLWCFYAAYILAGTTWEAAFTFISEPLNAIPIGATAVLTVWHMYMGLKVIIDDYIAKPATRGFLIFLTFALCAVVLIAVFGALVAPTQYTYAQGA